MKPKSIVTALLLVFVGASVAVLAVKEVRNSPGHPEAPGSGVVAGSPVAAAPAVPSEARPTARPDRVVAYYFHGRVRCASCRKIEALSGRAVRTGFPRELEDGRLEFRPVNVDEPRNRHFIAEYALAGQSLVIVRYRGGRQVGWKNLEKVWTLLESEREFIPYVQKGITAYLKEA